MVNIIGNLRYTDHSNAKMGPTQLLCKSDMSLDGKKDCEFRKHFNIPIFISGIQNKIYKEKC